MSRNRLYGSLNFFQKSTKKMTHESFLSRNKTPISFYFSSDALTNLLDMDPKTMPEDEDFVEWVAGNKVIKGSIPLSHRYGGYQFGHWVIMKEDFSVKL